MGGLHKLMYDCQTEEWNAVHLREGTKMEPDIQQWKPQGTGVHRLPIMQHCQKIYPKEEA